MTPSQTATAAVPLVRSINKLSGILQRATQTLQAIGVQCSGTKAVASTLTMMGHHGLALGTFEEMRGTTFDSAQLEDWVYEHRAAAASLQTSNAQCVGSFGSFIAVATQAMQQLDSDIGVLKQPSRGNDQIKLFATMWAFASVVCVWFANWGEYFEAPLALDLREVQPILHTFMVWLLTYVRDDAPQHQTLAAFKSLGHTWRVDVYKFMNATIQLLQQLHALQVSEECAALSAFPSGFFPTLCCLACESDPRPPRHPSSQMLACVMEHTAVLATLGNLLGRYTHTVTQEFLSASIRAELFCPASVEVAKRVVLACHAMPHIAVRNIIIVQSVLARLLALTPPWSAGPSVHSKKLSGQTPISTSGSSGSKSSRGAGSMLPQHATPNQALLSLLIPYTVKHPEAEESSAYIITNLANFWNVDGSLCGSEKRLTFMAGVLRFCSHVLIRSMRQQKQQQTGTRKQLRETHPLLARERLAPVQHVLLQTVAKYVEAFTKADGEC